jgi:hypothetical protein
MLTAIALILAQAPAGLGLDEEKNSYCSAERAISRRAWSLYLGKNELSDDKMISNGARILAMGAMMRPCDAVEGAEVKMDLSPLNEAEVEVFESYQPKGRFVAWANCLVRVSPEKARSYVESSDRSALIEYARTRRIGGHDEGSFIQLISTDECGEHFVEKVDAQVFYEDVNWFLRVAPIKQEMANWHKDNLDA